MNNPGTDNVSELAAIGLTVALLEEWANDAKGPVALHLKQTLLPVEASDGERGIVYPPTYADIGYNIDTLSDGKRVALIDSVGSQANRMEPIFKRQFGESGEPDGGKWLVPQIEIVLHEAKGRGKAKGEESFKEKRSILDLAHRGADAVVQSTPKLKDEVDKAFEALRRTGDAGPLCVLAPTSLVFGFWDSRGGSGEKRPRLLRAVIRAWDVDPLHAAAQFNSVWKGLSEIQQEDLTKEAKAKKVKLSEKGLKDSPATFRKTKIAEYRDGLPNLEARVLGGVLVRDRIERDVTVNLLALRNIRGSDDEEGKNIRKYLLGLSLIAATTEIDLFLREGCHLRYANDDTWRVVPRRGDPGEVDLTSATAREVLLKYTLDAAQPFRERWPEELEYRFDLAEAKKLLAKRDVGNPGETES